MTRFLVFDDRTADAVRKTGGDAHPAPAADVASTISDAVQQQRTVVLVVPAGPDRATVARITPPLASEHRDTE
jgi:hypothetical protein